MHIIKNAIPVSMITIPTNELSFNISIPIEKIIKINKAKINIIIIISKYLIGLRILLLLLASKIKYNIKSNITPYFSPHIIFKYYNTPTFVSY